MANVKLENGDDLRSAFRRDGVVCLRQVFDPDTMALAEAVWQRLADHPGSGAARLYADRMATVASIEAAQKLPAGVETGFFYQDIGNRHASDQVQALLAREDVRDIVQSVVTPEDSADCRAWFSGEQMFLKGPFSPPTGWHQDIVDTPLRGNDLLVIWMSFDPVDQAHALRLARGSHEGPAFDSLYGRFTGETVPDVDADPNFDVVGYATEPGDVVLFHYGCLHGGGRTGERGRRSLALRFNGPDCYRERSGEPFDPDTAGNLFAAS
jgi:ectoine hydroxylase-related dioxygenase (phytanoyl-CoA dioxygenase family)